MVKHFVNLSPNSYQQAVAIVNMLWTTLTLTTAEERLAANQNTTLGRLTSQRLERETIARFSNLARHY